MAKKYISTEQELTGTVNPKTGQLYTPSDIILEKSIRQAMSPYKQGVEHRQETISAKQDNFNDYGFSYQVGDDNFDRRAENQSWQDQLANGLTKAGVTAVTSFTESMAGLPIGIAAMALGQGFYENSFTDLLDNTNKKFQEWMPNYYSKAEEDGSIWDNMTGSMNFWADKFGNGLGYMVGAMAAGYSLNKFGSISRGLAGMRGEVAELKAMEQGLEKWGKTYKITNGIDFAKNAALASLGESGMEARGIRDGIREKAKFEYMRDNGLSDESQIPVEVLADIEKKAEAGGNVGFMSNLFITSIENAFIMPKMLGGKYMDDLIKVQGVKAADLSDDVLRQARLASDDALKAAQKAGKPLEEANAIAKEAFNTVIKDKGLTSSFTKSKPWLDRAQRIGSGVAVEGGQEGAQFATEKGLVNYYGSDDYDTSVGAGIDDILKALVNGAEETLGTKEGWESIILGGLLGGPSNLITTKGDRATQEAKASEVSTLLNSDEFYKLSKNVELLKKYQENAKAKEIALNNGDAFEYQNADFNNSKTFLKKIIMNGGTEALIEKLDAVSEMDKDEFKSLMGYSDKYTTTKTVKENIEDTKKLVTQLKDIHDSIERQFVNPHDNKTNPEEYKLFEDRKHRIWDYSSDFVNLDDRYKKIHEYLQKKNPATAHLGIAYENLNKFKDSFYKASDRDKKVLIKEKNRLVRELKATKEALQKENPQLYDESLVYLKDLSRIRERKEKVIASYNELVKPGSSTRYKELLDKGTPKEEIASNNLKDNRTKEDLKQDIINAGYNLDNFEPIELIINGKRTTAKWVNKKLVINGKPFNSVYNEHRGDRVLSKQEIEELNKERVENIKFSIRERQLTNILNDLKAKRDNVYNKIFKDAALKLVKQQEIDALIKVYKPGHKQLGDSLLKLMEALQKDIYALEESLEKDNVQLETYDRQIELFEQQLANDPSIDSVIEDLNVAKQQREYLEGQVKETQGLITSLKKLIGELKAIFNKLYPYAASMFKGLAYETVMSKPEVTEAGFEIKSKEEALNKLKETLSELNDKISEVDKKIEFYQNQINQYNAELNDIINQNKKKIGDEQKDNSNQIDISDADGVELTDEERQTQAAKSTIFSTAGLHLNKITDIEKADPAIKRWYRAISKLPRLSKDNRLFLRYFKANDVELGKYFTEEDKAYVDAIKVILVDIEGNPVLADANGNITKDGEPLYTFIHESTFAYDSTKPTLKERSRISHNSLINLFLESKGKMARNDVAKIDKLEIDGKTYSRTELIEEGAKLQAASMEAFKDKVSSELKTNNKVYTEVTQIRSGLLNKMFGANGQEIRNKINEVVNKVVRLHIIASKENKVMIPNNPTVLLSGKVYVEDEHGNYIPTLNRDLKEQEQDLVIDLLDYALNNGTKDVNNDIKIKGKNTTQHIFIKGGKNTQSLMSRLLFYGPAKDASKTDRQIYFSNGYLYFGIDRIPTSEIKTSSKLREFLSKKRLNVNKNLINDNGIYWAPVKVVKNTDGTMELEYKEYPNYNDYLIQEEVITSSLPTIKSGLPRFLQGHLKYSPTITNKPNEEVKPKEEVKETDKPSEQNESVEVTYEDLVSGNTILYERDINGKHQEVLFKWDGNKYIIQSMKSDGVEIEPTNGIKDYFNNLNKFTTQDELYEEITSDNFKKVNGKFSISKSTESTTKEESKETNDAFNWVETESTQENPEIIIRLILNNWINDVKISTAIKEKGLSLDSLKETLIKEYKESNEIADITISDFMEDFKKHELNC